MIQNKN